MTTDQIEKVAQTEPFKPFTLFLADGRHIEVDRPDFIARARSGRTITVYGQDDCAETIDALLITSIKEKNSH